MLSLFWGIGPVIVMYLLLRDWWDHGHWPLPSRDGDEGED